MGPPPNQRSQPMLMSLQPTPVPVPHTGIVFSGDRGCKLLLYVNRNWQKNSTVTISQCKIDYL